MVVLAHPHARTRLKAKMAELETKLNPPAECLAGLRSARHATPANKLAPIGIPGNAFLPLVPTLS